MLFKPDHDRGIIELDIASELYSIGFGHVDLRPLCVIVNTNIRIKARRGLEENNVQLGSSASSLAPSFVVLPFAFTLIN